MKYTLLEVERFPEVIRPGILYWSKEFGISAHLCACGCGDIIYLPVGPVDYAISLGSAGPTLRPSVGNWNVCNAHYFITNGDVQWAEPWSAEQISAARMHEEARRAVYYTPTAETFGRMLLRYGHAVLRWFGIGR